MANNDRFGGCITNDPKTKQKTNQIVTIFVFNESNVVLEMFFIFFWRFEIGHFCPFRFILSLFCPGLYVSSVPVHAIEASKITGHSCLSERRYFVPFISPSKYRKRSHFILEEASVIFILDHISRESRNFAM